MQLLHLIRQQLWELRLHLFSTGTAGTPRSARTITRTPTRTPRQRGSTVLLTPNQTRITLVQVLYKNNSLECEKEQLTGRMHEQRAEVTVLTQRLLASDNKRRDLEARLRELANVQQKLNDANKTVRRTNSTLMGYANEVQDLKDKLANYKKSDVAF